MNWSTALVLAGIVLLLAAAAVPLVGLSMAQWDTDYVYTVETNESYSANTVHETPGVKASEDYRVL